MLILIEISLIHEKPHISSLTRLELKEVTIGAWIIQWESMFHLMKLKSQ